MTDVRCRIVTTRAWNAASPSTHGLFFRTSGESNALGGTTIRASNGKFCTPKSTVSWIAHCSTNRTSLVIDESPS